MMRLLIRAFTAFSVGTVITQMILLSFFLVSGNLNRETGLKIVSLLNGIDITGNRLQQIFRAREDREQPDFQEILEARKREGMNMDLRLRSQRRGKADLSESLAYLTNETEVFDARIVDLNADLERQRQGALDEGLQEVQRTLQGLEPDQAKTQLTLLYESGRTTDVVSIIKAMPPNTRSEILAEFNDQVGNPVVHKILLDIADGKPVIDLINKAQQP